MGQEDILNLVILYLVSFGIGKAISFLLWWLRIVLMIAFPVNYLNSFAIQEINLNVLAVVIIPILIFEFPSIKKFMGGSINFPNPFSFVFNSIKEKQYMKYRLREMEFEREKYERVENITRMQTEEAERQRRHEREAREQQARGRARQEKERAERTENTQEQTKQESYSKKDNEKKQEPFSDKNMTFDIACEILGVTRDMPKPAIKKAYLKLMTEYAPDKVSHLSKEFQEIAHEKCIAFNLAWEKISKS